MDFLTQHQTPEALVAEFGEGVFKGGKHGTGRTNEYLDAGTGGPGIFAITGPKLPAYALNRLQQLKFIAKDRWHARIMARFTGEPISSSGKSLVKAWDLSEGGLSKRKLFDEAWGEVAKELGVEPADVAQRMWEMEHLLYSKLGVNSPVHLPSTGMRKGLDGLEAGIRLETSGDPLLKNILPQRTKGDIKGTFNPRTWLVQLIKGKADLSTSIHEVSGHWFENVLRSDPEVGATLTRVYGDTGSERFARHVEQYLMTGKSPIKGLKDVYGAIGSWMKQIYRGQRLEKMPREVRKIFDGIHSVESDRVKRLVLEFQARHELPTRGPLFKPPPGFYYQPPTEKEQRERMRRALGPGGF